MDETEASPSTNSRTERVNKRHSKSMDETTSPTRKKKKHPHLKEDLHH